MPTTSFSATESDECRWQAVQARREIPEQVFFYAVKTTGVFCRPNCPSRRPLRRNVEFFPVAEDAVAAGYRPCRRCRPTASRADADHRDKILEVCRILEECSDRVPSLAELGRAVGLSAGHLQRSFKAWVGVSPREYSEALRFARLRQGLRRGNGVTAASFEAGFNSSSRVYERSNERLGMSPKRYQQQGLGSTIRYVIAPSSIGHVLVAATEVGLCAVRIGDSPDALRDELEDEFARADFEAGDEELATLLRKVIAHVEEGSPLTEPPLDVVGTALQQRVWRALQEIPRGETRSYSELAAAVGNPGAVRAVASACAKNPLALVVPCHRVVPKNGGTGKYRWGDGRKAQLLELEKAR